MVILRDLRTENIDATYTNKKILKNTYYSKDSTLTILYILGVIIFVGPALFYIGSGNREILKYSILSVPVGTIFLFWSIHQHKKRKEMPDLSCSYVTEDEIRLYIPFRKGLREGLFNEVIKRKNIQFLSICFEQADLRSSFPGKYVEDIRDLEKVDTIFYIVERRFHEIIIHPVALDMFENPSQFIRIFQKANIPLKFSTRVFRFENELDRNQFFLEDAQFITFHLDKTYPYNALDLWKEHLTIYIKRWHQQYPHKHSS